VRLSAVRGDQNELDDGDDPDRSLLEVLYDRGLKNGLHLCPQHMNGTRTAETVSPC